MSSISKEDYQHAQRVWEEFGIHNLGDYHDLYLRTDVVLLANVFEAFRDTCLRHYSLDPAHFYTSPGLAWRTCLKLTGIKLELLTNPDMLLMFERGIRGEITQVVRNTYQQIINIWEINSIPTRIPPILVPRRKQFIWLGNVTTSSNWRI